MSDRIPVFLYASDPISRAGVVGQLRPRPEILVLEEGERQRARVSLVVADNLDEEAIRLLRAVKANYGTPLVVVATRIDHADLVNVVEVGVSGLVRRREASPERLVAVVRAAAAGDGSVPPDLLGRLLTQVSQVQRQVLGPRGLTFTGLAEREIQVLRLVADGFDTAEIAIKLSYSQRTVKNVLHDITSRLQLRNRSHAVAYALREGLI